MMQFVHHSNNNNMSDEIAVYRCGTSIIRARLLERDVTVVIGDDNIVTYEMYEQQLSAHADVFRGIYKNRFNFHNPRFSGMPTVPDVNQLKYVTVHVDVVDNTNDAFYVTAVAEHNYRNIEEDEEIRIIDLRLIAYLDHQRVCRAFMAPGNTWLKGEMRTITGSSLSDIVDTLLGEALVAEDETLRLHLRGM